MFVDLLRANIQSPEAYQRELELQQAQREVKRKQDAEKRKENQVKQQLDYDRQERKYIKASKDSTVQVNNFWKTKKIKTMRQIFCCCCCCCDVFQRPGGFGAQTKTFKDIGVDLNCKKGG